MRIGALVRVEWTKTMRMRTTYIAFGAVGVLVATIQIALFWNVNKSDVVKTFEALELPPSWIANGYQTTLITMLAAFTMLIAPMTIVTFARQVAGEDLSGTLRLILCRPISRVSLLNAKFIVCGLNVLLLMGFFFSLSYGLGLILFGPRDSITVPSGEDLDSGQFMPEDPGFRERERVESRAQEDRGERMRHGRREELRREMLARYVKTEQGREFQAQVRGRMEAMILTPRECIARLGIAWILTSWALMTLGSIAFFYSTVNRHPIAAMALTIGTYFMVVVLQALASASNVIPIFQKIEPYLFTSAMDFWRGCLAKEIDWSKIGKDAALLGAYTAAFYGIGQWIFWRKDITS